MMELLKALTSIIIGMFIGAIAGTTLGAFSGWVVGLFFEDTFSHVLVQFGLDVKVWQLGAVLGFVSAFFRVGRVKGER